MTCSFCHNTVPVGATYCPHCGAAQSIASTGETQRLEPPVKVATLRTGTCPICLSSEVYLQTGGIEGRTTGVNLQHWWGEDAPLNTYVCTQCGFIELYLAAQNAIPRIKQRWKKVVSDF